MPPQKNWIIKFDCHRFTCSHPKMTIRRPTINYRCRKKTKFKKVGSGFDDHKTANEKRSTEYISKRGKKS